MPWHPFLIRPVWLGILSVLASAAPPARADDRPAQGTGESGPVSFVRQVLPVLTRQGCNAGSCHGTPTGKNGFRLSLRGYDPALDIISLTRDVTGRRIDPIAPESSLLLLKGTATISHEGGRRLAVGRSPDELLRHRIYEGGI